MAKERDNPYVQNQEGSNRLLEITPEGYKRLEGLVTDTEGDVYVITDKLPATIAAAAMARLSRNPNDMRAVILDEFSNAFQAEDEKQLALMELMFPDEELRDRIIQLMDQYSADGSNPSEMNSQEEELLRRVITAFGDDSVQQLVGMHLVIENASNLLTKKIEWGRLAAYLEQSTRYIYFDEKDEHGQYRYMTPEGLPDDLGIEYQAAMDEIYDQYSDIVHKLTDYIADQSDAPETERDLAWRQSVRAKACDAARALLPVSTRSTVGIYASAQAIENMIMRMRASNNLEERETGDKILEQVRKVNSVFFERADRDDRGGARTAYIANTKKDMEEITAELLGQTETGDTTDVNLRGYVPPDELDLVSEMLYEQSNLSLDEIEDQLKDIPHSERERVFRTYFGERLNRRHRPGRALENAHYQFDLVCDYGIFRDLQRHRMVDDLEWQQLSPYLGYEVPELVKEAGLEKQFTSCFETSQRVYDCFIRRGLTDEAQYVTLLGHQMRWKVTMNAREAFHFLELRTGPAGHTGYRQVAQQMFEEIAKVHPKIAQQMRFINQDEDPELGRLAAERATQDKLERLGVEG